MIDFEIPEDARLVRDKVRAFVQSECHPAEEICTADNFETVLSELRVKARSQGLWCPFVPEHMAAWAYDHSPMPLSRWNLARAFSEHCR